MNTQHESVERPMFATVSPATLQQYATMLIERLAAEQLPELGGLIRVRGRWADPGRISGKFYYGAKLTDDSGAAAKVEIQASMVASRGIQPGQQAIVTGRLAVKVTNYGTELKLTATDIELGQDEEAVPTADTNQGRMTLERLCALKVTRNRFPDDEPTRVAVIQSSSVAAQVSQDFRAELDKLGVLVAVKSLPVNMLDPVAIAQAVRTVPPDCVLVMIRGGGDSADFEVFNDPRVVEALANHGAHRVVGLGHTGNATLLDLVADFSSNTPAQAGLYIREHIERRQRALGDVAKEMRLAKERMEALEKERNVAQQQAKVATELAEKAQEQAKSGFPLWAVATAFIAGAALVFLIR